MDETFHTQLNTTGQAKILIVVCHGFQSSSNNETLVTIVHGLNKNGYDTLMFDFSDNLGGFDVEAQVNDITTIVQNYPQYDTIVLLAASFGALPAAITARKQSLVQGLITLNGFFGKAALGEPYRKPYLKFRIVAPFIPKYRRIWQYLKYELRPSDISVPVLTIHSEIDRRVFISQSRYFFERVTAPKDFIMLKSANHGVSEPADRKLVIADITRWLKQTY